VRLSSKIYRRTGIRTSKTGTARRFEIVERYISRCSLILLFAWFTSLPVHAAEYCLRPGKEDGTEANGIVSCTTPTGWQGWKDDPRYWDGMDGFTRMWLQTAHTFSVSFKRANCKVGPKCAFLHLKTTARDSRGQPDVEAGLHDFLDQLEQPQDLSSRDNPCIVLNRFGTFDTENSGVLTIWAIRCPSGDRYLVTLLAQRDLLVTIDLRVPGSATAAANVDSLKELARSIRIADASSTLPDVIKIDVDLSDRTIRDQLLRLTPLGTPREQVYKLLESHLFKDTWDMTSPAEIHWTEDGGLYTQIGHYSNRMPTGPVPKPTITTDEELRSRPQTPPMLSPQTVVRAVWKFDKQDKLRDVEIQRQVVGFK
jgi:hypothetical protein